MPIATAILPFQSLHSSNDNGLGFELGTKAGLKTERIAVCETYLFVKSFCFSPLFFNCFVLPSVAFKCRPGT